MAIGGSDSVRKDLINNIISINKTLIDRGLDIFEWVPAHVGIVGKEKADVNAKKSLTDSSVGIKTKLNYKEVLSLLNPFLTKIWQGEWNNNQGTHHHTLKKTTHTWPHTSHNT